MARVVVFDDTALDVVKRYGHLIADRHDLSVFLLGQEQGSLEMNL